MFNFLRDSTYGRRSTVNMIKKVFPKPNHEAAILDLGVGFGEDLKMAGTIAQTTKLYAIDYHDKNRKVLEANNMTMEVRDIEHDTLPYKDGSFDLVIINMVLEHVKEIFWIMHGVTRALKRDGHVLIGLPNLVSLANRSRLLFGIQPMCVDTRLSHVRGFTPQGVKSFMRIPDCYKLVDFQGTGMTPLPSILAKIPAKMFPTLATCIHFLYQRNADYCEGFLEHTDSEIFKVSNFKGAVDD